MVFSRSLNELAVKVVAANMVETDRSLSGTHLLCAVGRYQEACSQLQDAGCWTDAATLAATHSKGTDYARVLHRWAKHVLHVEFNIWRYRHLFSFDLLEIKHNPNSPIHKLLDSLLFNFISHKMDLNLFYFRLRSLAFIYSSRFITRCTCSTP